MAVWKAAFFFFQQWKIAYWFCLAARGGSRNERPVYSTIFNISVIVKKILAFKAAQYTLECGFLHYIAGTILKAQEQHFFYVLVLFCCLKIFFKIFSENATNSCCVGSYGAERGIEGKQPHLLSRRKEVNRHEVIFFPAGYSSTVWLPYKESHKKSSDEV